MCDASQERADVPGNSIDISLTSVCHREGSSEEVRVRVTNRVRPRDSDYIATTCIDMHLLL